MAKRNFTDEEELEIARMYKAGLSTRAIARLLGLSHHISIVSALRRTGTVQRSPSERNEKYYVNPHAFDIIDNEAKAYWWGFLYADGYVRKRSLVLTLAIKDKHHVEKFRSFLKSEHPIKVRDKIAQGKPYPTAILFVTNKHLINQLRNLGISVDRTIFEWSISQLPPNLIHHWIRGFIDGDGSISGAGTNQPCIKLCGKPEVLNWVRLQFHLNLTRNANQAIRKHITANAHYLDYSGGRQCRKIRDYLYKDATVYLYRKRERFYKLKEPIVRQRDSKGRYI